MTFPAYLPDAIFWFTVLGAGAAALKHLLLPMSTFKELTPVAIRDNKISPEALWWGSICFAAMNVGYFTIGVWAGYRQSAIAKQAVLLGTGVMFEAFALAWFTRGSMTGKKDANKQGIKVAAFGALFLFGFLISK